jgi:hypothetical protein
MDATGNEGPRRFLTPGRLLIAAVVGAIGLAVVLVWFQPQKLFQDTRVNEPAPGAMAKEDDAMAKEDDAMAKEDEDFIDLGSLKGNIGDQNYLVPEGADLERYQSVVIWCRRFTSPFGAAPLEST